MISAPELVAQVTVQAPPMPEPYLTTEQVSAWIQRPTSWISQEAKAGRIPGHKIGRHWRFLRSELEAWIRGEWRPRTHASTSVFQAARERLLSRSLKTERTDDASPIRKGRSFNGNR
jgi:excisionase family DNA binding protein